MISQEHGFTIIAGVNVYDASVISQMIEKLLRNGLVSGKELMAVANLRHKLHGLVAQATGLDLDNPQPVSAPEKDNNEQE